MPFKQLKHFSLPGVYSLYVQPYVLHLRNPWDGFIVGEEGNSLSKREQGGGDAHEMVVVLAAKLLAASASDASLAAAG